MANGRFIAGDPCARQEQLAAPPRRLSVRPLDQSDRQLQPPPQLGFLGLHFAGIGFVVIADQMQQSVQDQDFQFGVDGMAEFFGIGRGDLC